MRTTHQLVRLLVIGLVAAFAGLAFAGPASARTCVKTAQVWNQDTLSYSTKCVEYSSDDGTGGTDETDGSTGPSEPSCSMLAPATFCRGTAPCYVKDVVTPFAPPKSKPPKPDADWHVVMCLRTDLGIAGQTAWSGTAEWIGTEPQPPSLQEQARTAYGNLKLPAATLDFNPPTRTVVKVPTWFWAQGLTATELTGSSAFGLVAIATPSELSLTPGDGSAQLACDWVTAEADTCSYTYRHSGTFTASAEATWKVRFEMNGTRINIPGAPTSISSPQWTAVVPVYEVQSTVTRTF